MKTSGLLILFLCFNASAMALSFIGSAQINTLFQQVMDTPINPSPTVILVTTTPPIFTVTPSPTPLVSQQDILAVYKDLVEANKETVSAAHNTLNVVMTIVSLVIALLVGAGFFSVVKIMGVVQKAVHAERRVKELEEKINSDTNILDQLHTQHTVDQYAMRLFSSINKESIGARKELLQLSKHTDPIIRRECLRVFGAMPNLLENWWDESVISRIKEMIRSDVEGGVRSEARVTYDLLMKEKSKINNGNLMTTSKNNDAVNPS